MMGPLVSIVIPIYNTERYLARCIQSLLKQSYKHIEIILVNDGSPDNSAAICEKYTSIDSRIMIINKENGGLSDARNAGIDAATGQFLFFVDSDDYVHEACIERMMHAALQHDCDIVQCEFATGTASVFPRYIGVNRIEIRDKVSAFYGRNLKITAWAKLYKSCLFSGLRYPVGKINEDEFVTYRAVYAAKRIALMTQPLYYYYQSPHSIMRTQKLEPCLDFVDAFAERVRFFGERNEHKLELISRKELAIRAILYYIKYPSAKLETKQLLLATFDENYRLIKGSNIASCLEWLFFRCCAWNPNAMKLLIKLLR